jgi:predicted HTH domain antitoxin
MPKVEIEFPEEVLMSLAADPGQLPLEAARQLAYDYFSQGRLSSGLAARLARMSRAAFLLGLSEYGIPWADLSPEEVEREMGNA